MATEEVLLSTEKAVKEVDNLDTAIKKSTKTSEKHSETLLDNAKDFKIMGVSVNSLAKGFKGTTSAIKASVVGLKAFKVALIATGIGLIVVALGSLFAVLKKTQGGMDLMTKATNVIGAVFDQLVSTAIGMGKGLAKTFTGLGKMIVGFLKNDITAMAQGWEDVKEGAEGMSKSVGSFTKDLKNTIKVTNSMSDALAKLELHQIQNISLDAERRLEMKEFNKLAEDTDLTLEKRLEASNAAVEVEERRLQAATNLSIEELRIARQTFSISFKLNADKRTLAELEKKVSNQREEAAERLTTQVNKSNILQDAIHAKEMARIAAEVLARKEQAQSWEDAIDREIARAELKQEKLDAITQAAKAKNDLDAAKIEAGNIKRADAEVALKELTQNTILGLARATFSAIQDSLQEGSIAQRAVAIGEILINAAIAAVKIISQLGVFSPPAIALLATAVAFQIRKVTQVKPPPAVTFGGEGLILEGPSHEQGGINFGNYNLEGNEAVINKRSTAMYRPLLSRINQAGGGRSLMADGGIIRNLDFESGNSSLVLQPVLVLDDLHTTEARVRTTEERAEL